MNCDQHGSVNGKSTLSNILESIDIINEYIIRILYIWILARHLIRYLIIVY